MSASLPLRLGRGLVWRLPGAAWRRALPGLAGLALLLGLWWLGTVPFVAEGGFARRFAPGAAFASLWELAAQGELLTHVALSLRRVLVGLALALLIGVPLGLLLGGVRAVEAAASPAFQFLRMISPLSWMPVAVMVFGVGDAPIHFLLAFAALWPILLNTAEGVRRLDPRWLLLARSLAATRWETLARVVLPGVLAPVLTGTRLAIGILWIVLVPAEMLGVSGGLGYLVLDTRDRLAYSELMAVILLIGLLGFLLDAGARALYRLRAPGHARTEQARAGAAGAGQPGGAA
ncbi:ABC transporter permease subunit [Roseomonas sp. GC11]|uniref:ABC transporter permease n=1 Tax=Roseomonas sp. GC11 TaxID=2950546 RepID=UPI00210865F2|nr:ABC transporter permease subunit [Roseomonas sp. GC11]MCQ4158675.1 ABC transporter permease subunit [Roseomonas sp. GC11]